MPNIKLIQEFPRNLSIMLSAYPYYACILLVGWQHFLSSSFIVKSQIALLEYFTTKLMLYYACTL